MPSHYKPSEEHWGRPRGNACAYRVPVMSPSK
jgi:hypothetical protein